MMTRSGKLLFVLGLAGIGLTFGQALPGPQTGDENRHFNQAVRFERLNQLDEAEAIYRQLLTRNPRNTRVYLQLKSLYRRQKRFDDLETLINDRLTLFPNDLQSQVELGELYLERGETDRAVKQWEEVLHRYPRSQAAYRLVLHMAIRHQMDDFLNGIIERGRTAFNDPSFFSLELANVYAQRESFDQAAHEYVTYVIHHPDRMATVSSQLLRMSDHPESQGSIEAELLKRMAENEKVIRTLYTHLLFKVGRYEDAFAQHEALGLNTDESFQRWLQFANNLRKENELALALEAFRVILRGIPLQPENPRADRYRKLTGEALYGLALTYEKQIIPPREYRSLAGYFPHNVFFEDPFHGLPAIQVKPLEETFALYDSILVTLPSTTLSPQAHFRLGEIKYRITRDFDGALTSYRSALSLSRSPDLTRKTVSRIADVLMAKGDFPGALRFLDVKLAEVEPGEMETTLRLKKCQTLFLAGEIDSALYHLTDLMGELNDTNPYLNDVLELKGFIDENYGRASPQGRSAFLMYVEGERLLKQAKLSEARRVLQEVALRYPHDPVTQYALFRGGKIDVLLREWDRAVKEFMSLRNAPIGDRATVAIGEIYQYHLNDAKQAAQWYLTVLEDYPGSLLSEPVRQRIRAISSGREG